MRNLLMRKDNKAMLGQFKVSLSRRDDGINVNLTYRPHKLKGYIIDLLITEADAALIANPSNWVYPLFNGKLTDTTKIHSASAAMTHLYNDSKRGECTRFIAGTADIFLTKTCLDNVIGIEVASSSPSSKDSTMSLTITPTYEQREMFANLMNAFI